MKVRQVPALGLRASISDFLLAECFYPLLEMTTKKQLGWRKLFLILTGRLHACIFHFSVNHTFVQLIINPTSFYLTGSRNVF